MSGEIRLARLLARMAPELRGGVYVFCTRPAGTSLDQVAGCDPLATFGEDEGLSVVLARTRADELGWDYEGEFRCITLGVHSSLAAVGLTAAVASRLAERGISANVVAAFHHDHVFVPAARADEALAALYEMTTSP